MSCKSLGAYRDCSAPPTPKEALNGLIFHVLSSFILLTMLTMSLPVSNMLNKLHGQPDTYDKKYVT
jgi:hypothetical protein